MKRAAAFLLLVTLGWIGSGVAGVGAGPPQQMATIPFDETNVLADCGGFEILDRVTGEMTVTMWPGKDGQAQRIVTEQRGRHDMRSSVSGVAVISNFHRRITTDVAAGETRIVGPAYQVTVPGYGSVLFETGVMTFGNGTFKLAGRHDVMNADVDRLCAAFA